MVPKTGHKMEKGAPSHCGGVAHSATPSRSCLHYTGSPAPVFEPHSCSWNQGDASKRVHFRSVNTWTPGPCLHRRLERQRTVDDGVRTGGGHFKRKRKEEHGQLMVEERAPAHRCFERLSYWDLWGFQGQIKRITSGAHRTLSPC